MIPRNILFSFFFTAVCVLAKYTLKFDRKSSPPHSVPANPLDMYFSVPLNQSISKPIIAYVLHQNESVVTDGVLSHAEFTIQSINVDTWRRKKVDTWADSGGKLCQKAVWWEDYPTRMDRSRAKERCGVYPNATMLTVQAFKGRIIVDWISHNHVNIPQGERILRIMFQEPQLSIDSYPIRIFEPAARIVVTSQPPSHIEANHDFSITAEIKDQNNTLITEGLDSVAFVELTVPYYYKTFYGTEGKEMLVKTTSIRLAGKNVVNHQSTYDLISRQRASGGIVKFIKIRILDEVSDIKLNLTMLMSRDPWIRIPICPSCYDDTKYYSISADDTEISFPNLAYKNIKPIRFTNSFSVIEQKLKTLTFSKSTLQILNKSKINGKIRVTRNVSPDFFFLEARDSKGSIIYSGSNSSFQLKYQTNPSGVCISSDATTQFSGGGMHIYFSICQIINNVEIQISTHNGLIHVTTPTFDVVGNINIAHFGDFQYSGSGTQIQFHLNNIIKTAAKDVNQGLQAKSLSTSGFKLNVLDTYNYMGDAYNRLNVMMREDLQPADRPHIIISSTKDETSRILNSELNKFHMPYISVSNSADAYINHTKYPHFCRVCWSEYSITRSVLMAVQQRMWTKLILVRTESDVVGDTFRDLAAEMGISIRDEVRIKDFSADIEYRTRDLKLDRAMGLIKSFGSKIIFLFADEKRQPYILRAAYLSDIDSDHGYQWVLMSAYAWQFPFLNPGVCARGLKCTSAFRGTIIFSETYNVSGYLTEEWVRVLSRHYSTDRFNLLTGSTGGLSPEVISKIGLGYDAVLLFAKSLIQIVKNNETITGDAITENLRKVEVNGLTGKLTLDENGDRTGYLGFIGEVWPPLDKVGVAISDVLVPVRLLTYRNDTQYEIPYQVNRSRLSPPVFKSLRYNMRKYESITGLIYPDNQMHIRRPGEAWPPREIEREEKVIPPFYCLGPCGNKLLSDANINIYDTGECTAKGNCSCHRGYTGKECKLLMCHCKHGMCISLKKCRCSTGWYGANCDIAQCKGCVHGKCIAPETCQCNSTMWIGYACHIHLAIVLAFTLLFSIVLIFFMIYYSRRLIRRMRRNADLSKVDWIVQWSTVTFIPSNDTVIRRCSISYKEPIRTYIWKNESWYVKFFNNRTMDSKDEELCLEILQLTKLRHRNLIVYGGACLTAPNVALFLEPVQKESLNDILLLESVELGWDFRYSFMKDICSGMCYLHEKTDLGSHGRLKSQNCLVDGHWTIRLSGFGAPTMRYGKYSNPPSEEEILVDLLWTAPEFLRLSHHLDDVKMGSKAGDVYSFAIVASEIVTRAEPYAYERDYIETSTLTDLILGNNYLRLQKARRTWEDIGGNHMVTVVRPILKKELMPDQPSVRSRLIKLLGDAWHMDPLSRPTFDSLIQQLNIICPVKGELIDNVMHLLEAYSNNLETTVVERTEELEANKQRFEGLLCEMLPSNVAYELTQNGKVLPTIFECATVFFSDIADFPKTCQDSSPLQIVTLLNETYNVFDEVLNGYDVYKVETISDTYIVASGVPITNKNRHAGEICTMALDLMSTVTTFIIPHRPKATLQLRIGINSGPVVAGVVGLLMPRYCLFGDTVNTASRMMSSSYTLCIQISDTTADILEELGGYDMESRGEREVKGRGLMTTYWLWGKDGFRKRLPDLSLAVSLSQHKFK